jgi:acetate---CoA ligase (ADP-forming)
VMRNLLDGFAGELIPIHPSETEILDHRVYPSICDVPEPVDLALVAVPTDAVLQALKSARRLAPRPP